MNNVTIVIIGIGLIIMIVLIGMEKSLLAILVLVGLIGVVYQRFFSQSRLVVYSSVNSSWTKSRTGEIAVKGHRRVSSLGKPFPVRPYLRSYPSSHQRSSTLQMMENRAWSSTKKLLIIALLTFVANQLGMIG